MPFAQVRLAKGLSLILAAIFVGLLLTACNDNSALNRLERVTAPPVNATVAATVTLAATSTPTLAPTATQLEQTTAPTATSVAPTVTATIAPPTATPKPALPPIKSGVLLEPMAWEGQTWNNCGPMAALMAVSYFGIKMSQEQVRIALRPNSNDKLVRPDEIVSFIEKQGLKTVVRENGSLDKLRQFLSAGIPVITEQWLEEGDDIAHYRVARGYDTGSNIFVFGDSMGKGPQTIVKADLQDRLWKAFNRRYFPVYTVAQESTAMAILGDEADTQVNTDRAFEAAQAYSNSNPGDIDGWRNLGYMTYVKGDYAGAVQIWEQKVAKLVKPNDRGPYSYLLWYDLWPFESYNKIGRYDAVIKLAPNEIAAAKAFAEARYQYAIALNAVGRKAEAIQQLQAATQDDTNFQPAREMLTKLQIS